MIYFFQVFEKSAENFVAAENFPVNASVNHETLKCILV